MNLDIQRMVENQYFIKKQVNKITEMDELEKKQKVELKQKQKIAKEEMGTTKWARQFVRDNIQYSFTALVRYNLGKKIENPLQVLIECLTGWVS